MYAKIHKVHIMLEKEGRYETKTLFNFTYIPEKKLLKQGSESGQPVLSASDNNARKRDKIITEDKGNLQNLLSELDKLVGLAKVKELVREIMAFVEISRRRERFNLKNENLVLHMIFSGNPGTGKPLCTAARQNACRIKSASQRAFNGS